MNGALLTDVCAQLQASDDDVRIAALKAMTADDCISPAVREQLSIAIYSPSAVIRIAALRVWNRCGGGFDPQVVTHLTDPVDAVRLAAFKVVLRWESADFLMYIRRGLRDRSSAVRLFILEVINTSPEQVPVEVFQGCLSDKDNSVACKSAEILAARQDPLGIEWLLARYKSPGLQIKKHTIRILGKARVTQAVPLLLNEIATRSDFMIPAIYALGMIAHPDALRPLLALICSPVLWVANAAVTSLIRYQHPLVVIAMRQAMRDKRKMVCYHATKVLVAYRFIPDINEAAPYFCDGGLAYVNQRLQTYLHGDHTTVLAALTTLHQLNVFQGNQEHINCICRIIRAHPEFVTLVQALLASPHHFFIYLGLSCIDKTIVDDVTMQQLLALYHQSDFSEREAIQKYFTKLVHSAPQMLVSYWGTLPLTTKEQCIRYVLSHPDQFIRAYALYDSDATIRKRCMRFFYKMDNDTLRTTLAQFRATEVAHIATWPFDEQIHNLQMAHDIVAVLQQMVIPPA